MRGLMMDRPLLLSHFLERAEKLYPRREIVSRFIEPSAQVRRRYFLSIAAHGKAAQEADLQRMSGIHRPVTMGPQ